MQTESEAEATFEVLGDDSVLVAGKRGDEDSYRVRFTVELDQITAIRMEVLTHPSLPKGGPGRADNGNFVLHELNLQSSANRKFEWLHATADYSQDGYDIKKAIDGDMGTGWAINVTKGVLNKNHTATFVLKEGSSPEQGSKLELVSNFGPRNPGYNIGRFRIAVTAAPRIKLGLPDPDRKVLVAELDKAKSERDKFAKAIPTTMVMREVAEPRGTAVLIRGDFLRRGDVVKPSTPSFLPAIAAVEPINENDANAEEQLQNRLGFARWLVNPDHPLTSRVTVNRVWMQYFGRGIVETENDFGMQGTRPTHPMLLDWLASEFVEQGWSMKRLHRLIVSSATYRQSSKFEPSHPKKDPNNIWLSRQSRLRVDAEIVRDLGLAVSGLLHDELGGPSVYPPQPDGVYAFTQRKAAWPTSKGHDRYRRGMYTFFMRSAPYPMLTTFDTPRFNTTCTQRTRSNTPLQSLAMANDQAMLESIRGLGARISKLDETSDRERVNYSYRVCFSRQADDRETERLLEYIKASREGFQNDISTATKLADAVDEKMTDEEVVELAVWVSVARVLVNLDEFITRE